MKVFSALILTCLLTTGLFKNCENENIKDSTTTLSSKAENKKINNERSSASNTVTTLRVKLEPIVNHQNVSCLCNSANRL